MIIIWILYAQNPWVLWINLAYMACFLWISLRISERFSPCLLRLKAILRSAPESAVPTGVCARRSVEGNSCVLLRGI
ncbi:MAG: hypothetical protein DCC75_11120 [Proteobacteria bacterium]|nr:MAG: hypothetical protein DCC75_11120 [Pseudomonadota bacterium]